MAYRILVSPRAQKEIEYTINFYALYSINAPSNFFDELTEVYTSIQLNPFLAVAYKEIRFIRLRRFPFNIYFFIDESRKTIRVLSCFHNKRDPRNRP
jgi:plasmid stabilization system protein ParE